MRRTKEESEQTRQKIIEAALSLFSSQGYANTTFSKIAAEAGCSRGPIYWHFSNKNELFEEILSYSQQPLEDLVKETLLLDSSSKAIKHFLSQWIDLLLDDRRFRESFEILLNKTELTDAMSRTIKREKKLTDDIIAMFATLLSLDKKKSTASIQQRSLLAYTYIMGISQSWLFRPSLFNLREEKAFFIQRLLVLLK